MKLAPKKRQDLSSATITQTLALICTISFFCAFTSFGAAPIWWSTPGANGFSAVMPPQVVTNTATGLVTTNYVRNDYAVVTQGQVKQFTARAVAYLNANLTNGAGTNLNTMVSNWAQDYLTNSYNATNLKPSDFTAENVGQLKTIGAAVYGRLAAYGYPELTPSWLHQNTLTDSAVANLGQLKQVFNFDLSLPAASSLTATASGSGSINLNWSLPSTNNVTSWLVEQQNLDNTWTILQSLTNPNANSYAVTGLINGQSYNFQVIGVGASSVTLPVRVSGGPAAPTATPTFSPPAGTYWSAQTVTISSSTPGATIYYTVDGSAPTTGSSSMASAGTLNVAAGETIKAIAVAASFNSSAVASAAYTIQALAPTNLTARAAVDEIDLAWTNSAGPVTSLLVQQLDYDGVTWDTIDTLPPTQSTYAVTGDEDVYVYFPIPGTFQVVAVSDGNSAASASVTDLPDEQTAGWSFNEGTGTTTTDNSGFDNQGTLVGGPAWVAGISGQALQFNGNAQFVQVADSTSLELGANSLTLSGWFQASATAAVMPLLSKELTDATGYHGFHVALNASGAIEVKLGDASGTGALVFATQASFTDNQWHQVLVEIDQNAQAGQIIVDGVAQNLTLVAGSVGSVSGSTVSFAGIISLNANTAQPLYLGAAPSAGRFFNGTLDEVQIYNHVASSSELAGILDSNNNGLPDWWEAKYFHALVQDASSSPNGNGFTLLQDYQQGNDPTNFYSQNGQLIVPTIMLVSGNNQVGLPGSPTDAPLVVQVINPNGGAALPNAPVAFTVLTGGGQLATTYAGGPQPVLMAHTDNNGQAQAYYVFGAGSNVSSTISVRAGSQTQSFTESTSPGDGTFDAPSDAGLSYPSATEIDLSWVNHATSATGILIRQSTDNVNWTTTATLSNGAATSYAVTGLTVGQTYYFSIAPTR